jgi:hypothetical protein
MGNSRYEAVVAFLLYVDRDILLYIVPVDLFFSIAVVAVLSRGRKPLELVTIFLFSFAVLFVVASLVFRYVFNRPFALLEVYSFP